MVLVDSQWFSVVLPVGSRRFSMVLVGSQWFSGVLVGCQCSCKFSMVLSGFRRFSMFLSASCWFS